jgi:hypothetical protein
VYDSVSVAILAQHHCDTAIRDVVRNKDDCNGIVVTETEVLTFTGATKHLRVFPTDCIDEWTVGDFDVQLTLWNGSSRVIVV